MPETRFGFGAAGVGAWRFSGEPTTSRVSQVDILSVYSLNGQLLAAFDWEVYRNNNQWKYIGTISYNDYFYYYFGIGQDSKLEDREKYFTSFPRVKLEVHRLFWKKYFAGLTYVYNRQNFKSVEPGGLLDRDVDVGSGGGTTSTIGLILQMDTRDRVNDPSKGWLNEVRYMHSSQTLGSSFDYNHFKVSIQKYTQVKEEVHLALSLKFNTASGDVPFFDMNNYGGAFVGRGYADRRFRDKNSMTAQAEVRFPIYKRFNGVIFASTGTVASTFPKVFSNRHHPAGGVGLRYFVNMKDRQMLRLDMGYSKEGVGMYFTANNAF